MRITVGGMFTSSLPRYEKSVNKLSERKVRLQDEKAEW